MLPVIHGPLTKKLSELGGVQDGPCGAFYMDFLRCASIVGTVRAKQVDCVKELADFHECSFGAKQAERVKIIRQERERQNRPYQPPVNEDVLRFKGNYY